ncbi:bacteriocin [Paraclostridium sordellii]|uniref:bacteriocin n=1 Tax=Paraclostridium sordellii TaxID=1505 RepID=UPI0005E4E4B5|nr:bacteriocin [Paeniclostridium sordellii]CEN22556.1 Uncharacterised protein [[Clostridium] sordellii] [Paeniclostridium sordellii]CEN23881.1 Uncharacterised protein [[Clostridium] sordellii] [Paeniclostridium sordellii]
MKELNVNELEQINGGNGYAKAAQFIKDYVIGKGLDWAIAHKSEIWRNFKKGPGKNDPMRQTSFYKIFGRTNY